MRSLPLLFALFLAIPLIEIVVLIKVGGIIGAGWTIILVVATALMGAVLVRTQGLATFSRIQNLLGRGEIPAIEMCEAMALFLAGALLLTPGFVTDSLGFLLLVPGLRRWIILHFLQNGFVAAARPSPQHRPPLEGQWRHKDDS
ncbi:MAG: FxsA family protein [Gammaproteobacteria bacterium]|nr:FxsA family protein [Gammaproteobacteria bacterium]